MCKNCKLWYCSDDEGSLCQRCCDYSDFLCDKCSGEDYNCYSWRRICEDCRYDENDSCDMCGKKNLKWTYIDVPSPTIGKVYLGSYISYLSNYLCCRKCYHKHNFSEYSHIISAD